MFYNGLTEESRFYLDSISENISTQRTLAEARNLLDISTQNDNPCNMEEEEMPKPTGKRKGMLTLSQESRGKGYEGY